MTKMVLFGSMFLAFAIPVSVFFFVVRKSPKLVITMVTRYGRSKKKKKKKERGRKEREREKKERAKHCCCKRRKKREHEPTIAVAR